jgi:hypothetical protein
MAEFAFRNSLTEEVRRGQGFSLNLAARSLGIKVPFRGSLEFPWFPWECWEGDRCLWHFTHKGECAAGPRP